MISIPRAVAIWNAWITSDLKVHELDQADLELPFYDVNRDWRTLRQAMLLTTTSYGLMMYLLQTGQGRIENILSPFMRRCVLLCHSVDEFRRLWKACGGSSHLLWHLHDSRQDNFYATPLGTAIQGHQIHIVRLFMEWGCRMPLDMEWHDWAWQIQEDVCARKARCAEAIVAFHLACPRFGGWRDIRPIMEQMIWNTRYQACWETK